MSEVRPVSLRHFYPSLIRQRLRSSPARRRTAARALADVPTVIGRRTFSVAFTEPEAGSDAASIKTRALRDGDGWILNGSKIFISDGEYSDFFVVSAVTDPSAGARGISLFLIDKGTPGFTLGPANR